MDCLTPTAQARELCQVSQATKALTALSSSDEVWRGLVASGELQRLYITI